jgi:hypothetical protein
MKIQYAIWQGGRLLSYNNISETIKEIDRLIEELNDTKIGKRNPFSAKIIEIEAGN